MANKDQEKHVLCKDFVIAASVQAGLVCDDEAIRARAQDLCLDTYSIAFTQGQGVTKRTVKRLAKAVGIADWKELIAKPFVPLHFLSLTEAIHSLIAWERVMIAANPSTPHRLLLETIALDFQDGLRNVQEAISNTISNKLHFCIAIMSDQHDFGDSAHINFRAWAQAASLNMNCLLEAMQIHRNAIIGTKDIEVEFFSYKSNPSMHGISASLFGRTKIAWTRIKPLPGSYHYDSGYKIIDRADMNKDESTTALEWDKNIKEKMSGTVIGRFHSTM